jgi:hypothetical protein
MVYNVYVAKSFKMFKWHDTIYAIKYNKQNPNREMDLCLFYLVVLFNKHKFLWIKLRVVLAISR